jgi:predicted dehydrogenase
VVGDGRRSVSFRLSGFDTTTFDPSSLQQTWPAPSRPSPIVTICAGSIVVDAHFPPYRQAGFPIAGVFDLNAERARMVGEKFSVRVFGSLAEALSTDGAVFDLATPPAAHLSVLGRVASGAGVLIQKPMGPTSTGRPRS